MKQIIILGLCLILTNCSSESSKSLASAKSFSEAQEITIYSLLPGKSETKEQADAERLDGVVILGQVTLTNTVEINQISQAIQRSIDTKVKSGSDCFYPRHAVVAGTDHFIICFQCNWLKLNGKTIVIDNDGQTTLNEIWKKHNLTLAD